jgi:uncharacterized protein YbjT (DUF2867 family)
MMQPIASEDVAAALAEIAVAAPINGMIEVAGPEPIRINDLVGQYLSATQDDRTVETDVNAGYFGTEVNDQSLTPGDHPILGATRFEAWLRNAAVKK